MKFLYLFLSGFCLMTAQPLADDPDQTVPPAPTTPSGGPLAPIAVNAPPQTVSQKFMDYAVDSYGPRALFTVTIPAGFSMLNPPRGYPREWRHGLGAYGRLYGSKLATRTTGQTARFMAAALLHEDVRYRPSLYKKPAARIGHAFGYAFVDRSDSGHRRLAVANFAGAAAAGFVQQLYMPPGFNTPSRSARHIGFTFGAYIGGNIGREFAPELGRLVRRLRLPKGGFPVPEWWTPRK